MRIPLRTLPVKHEGGNQIGSEASATIDVTGLENLLKQSIRGEVRFDAGTRGMYAHDASNYRMVPVGVVIPRTYRDVERAVACARSYGVPLLSRGGGTAIPGQGVNNALMIDFSKYLNRVLQIDETTRTAVVQPGCILDDLRNKAQDVGLTFGPDPATHSRNTLGGMIGNNSCGIHSVMAGRTSDNVLELEILLYDGTRMRVGPTNDEELDKYISRADRVGEIYGRLRDIRDRYADLIRARYPNIPRRISGYNLDELLPENGFNVARALVGTEGTCITVLEAVCNLVPYPAFRSLVVLGFPDVASSGDFVPRVLESKPIACEGLDNTFLEDMRKKNMHPKHIDLLPEGKAWLLVEFGANTLDGAKRLASEFTDSLKSDGSPPHRLLDNPEFEKALWHLREEGLGATARIPGEKVNHEGWEDTAVHPDKVGSYLRDFQKLIDKFGYHGSIYGHFGDGCVHVRLDFDLETSAGIEHYRRFAEEGAKLVVQYNGSLSGEHGDGQARGELLERMYGPELISAFAEFKSVWDPDWKMNPGKVIAPYKLDENLELGTTYSPPHLETHFIFPDDRSSFAFATRRCVGAGVCRRLTGGTMCPSYMVTREEKHSTRGRARMLFEMLEGDPVQGCWQSEEVKGALDLCLACKGCKGECPVQVDMASYKAEFLSHYYEKKFRPRQAYFFGFIQRWATLAAIAPGFVNLVSHAPILGTLTKKLIGVAPQRQMPEFASTTFRAWWAGRQKRNVGLQTVILWADTFTNHFHPAIAKAAVEVLEAAGFQVLVPQTEFCCGRPLYDYGFLDHAKAYLTAILNGLQVEIRKGTPIVVLEPSCCSVFRDELLNLFPDNEDAKRLSTQTFLLSEFLMKRAPHYKPGKLQGNAVLHGHCHHKALFKMDDEKELLATLGLEIIEPDSGCCGMAGSFGFEPDQHYEVSMKCGERVLLPTVRSAEKETFIIADGFSCREQIAQTTDRRALHFAQVLSMATRTHHDSVPAYPERQVEDTGSTLKNDLKTAILVGACLFGAYKLCSLAISKSRRRAT